MLSDAFVAAWLPGTEAPGSRSCSATGCTTLLAGCRASWPANKCDNTINSTRHTWPTSRSPV